MTPAAVGFQCPECLREGRATVRGKTTPYGARVVERAYATYTLIAVNVLVFLATLVSGGSSVAFAGGSSGLYDDLALTTRSYRYQDADGLVHTVGSVSGGQYYRLATSAFMHAGLLHLAFNMLALLQLGPLLERLFGWWRFLAVYAVAGLGGSVATYLFAGEGTATVGASGAIFGLFAAYFVVARQTRSDTSQILLTIGINLAITFAVPQISKTGHLGGLALGAIAGALVVYVPAGPRRTVVQVVGLVVLAAVLVAVTLARTSALTG